MNENLDVTISIDMDAATLTLQPSGPLTDRNVGGIIPVVRRAETTLAGFIVTVDLERLHCAAPGALRSLREAGVRTFGTRRRQPTALCRFHAGREAAA